MKTFKLVISRLLLLSILPLLLIRCNVVEDLNKLQASADSIKLIIGTPEFRTQLHMEFKNAATDQYISEIATVTVSGKNAASIYSNIGTFASKYSSSDGMLDLIVNPNMIDTTTLETKPVEIELAITAEGYLSYNTKVYITENNTKNLAIPLIKISEAPSGVAISLNNAFTSIGANGMVLNTSTENMNNGNQTVEVPAGTIMKDKNGEIVRGNVSSQIVFYEPTSNEAISAIPGSLDVQVKLADNTNDEVSFSTAGMFGISLKADGKEITNFENGGVKISTKLNPQLLNPMTGEAVKAGDVIEMWSRNEGSGEWVFDKMDTVRLINGDLVLDENVKHLSTWNWDWMNRRCNTSGLIIKFVGDVDQAYTHIKTINNQSRFISSYSNRTYRIIQPINNSMVSFRNIPRNLPVTFQIEPYGSDIGNVTYSPSTITVSDLCSPKTIEVKVTENKVNTISVDFDLVVTPQTSSNFAIKPNVAAYYAPTSSFNSSRSLFILKNGIGSLKLKLGTEYTLYGSFGNASGFGKLRLDDAGANKVKVTFTPSMFSKSDGSPYEQVITVEKLPNNRIPVKYNFKLPDSVFNQMK